MKHLFVPTPRKLTGLFILITVCLFALSWSTYVQQKDKLKYEIFRDLTILADSKAKRLEVWRMERYGDAGIIMNSPGFITYFEVWMKNPLNVPAKKFIDDRLNDYYTYFRYGNIILLDSAFNVKLSLTKNIRSIENEALKNLKESIKYRKPFLSNVFISEIDSSVFMDVAAPLYFENRFIGSIILRINPHDLLIPELNSRPTESESGETLLASLNGDYVEILNDLRFRDNSRHQYKIPNDSVNAGITTVKGARGFRGLTEGIDYRGVKTLNCVQGIKDSPWFVVAKIDMDEVYSPMVERAIVLLSSAGFILFTFGIIFIWIWTSRKKSVQINLLEAETQKLAIIKHYEYLVKFANDVMILSDDNLDIIDANERAAVLYGYSREEMLNMNLKDFLTPDSHKIFEDTVEGKDVLKEGIVYETVHRRKDGNVVPVEVSVNSIEVNGKLFHQRMIRDITERKTAEKKLMESESQLRFLNAEKDRLFSIIAHDLKGPLGTYMMLTDFMEKNFSTYTKDEIYNIIRQMKVSTSNIYNLLENLLDWSVLQRGKGITESKSLNLSESILASLNIAEEAMVKKNIDLRVEIPDGISVFADSKMLNSIVRNFITNAVKFTPHGGKITVSAENMEEGLVKISVSDTGIGMSMDMIDNLFNFEVNSGRKGTDNEPSSGLGLFLCKEMAEKNKGKIFVESEEGKGSTFSVVLPKGTED